MRDFVLGPVAAGLIRYESLLDGSLDLGDIALLQDLLAVRAENEYRSRRAAEKGD